MNDWWIFRGTRTPHDLIAEKLPEPPKWRRYHHDNTNGQELPDDLFIEYPVSNAERGATYLSDELQVDIVNAALYLRRPLLVTGKPGSGKTSLAYAIAYELKLGPVLIWPITSRSTLQDGLYRYDAVARLHATTLAQRQSQVKELYDEAAEFGRYLRLGPLGTALRTSRPKRPRVLLIDEIDKSDI